MFVFREIWRAFFLKHPFWDLPFCLITNEFKVIPTTVMFEPDEVIIHTLVLMRICRLIFTFITFGYWKLTIEFVRKTCKYFSYCSFKYCILALVNILLFLFWFAECRELRLLVLLFFIKTFWDKGLKTSWRTLKILYSNSGIFIPKMTLFDVFSGFKSK